MPKARRYHHGDLRQTLLDGAVALIDGEGMRDFSLRRLAAQAGVSHAAPYRHFESKDEILATLLLEGHKRLRADLLAVRAETRGKAADKMMAMARTYLEFSRKHPVYLSIMFSREGLAAARTVREKLAFHAEDYDTFGLLESAVREAQAEGSMDPKADVSALSFLVWSEVHGLALLRNAGSLADTFEARGMTEAKGVEMIYKIIRGRLARRPVAIRDQGKTR